MRWGRNKKQKYLATFFDFSLAHLDSPKTRLCLHFQFAQKVHSSFSSDYSHNTQPEIANHPRCPHLSFVFVTSWPISWPSKNSKPPSPTHLFILLVLPGVHSYPPHSFCLSKSSLFLKTQLNSFSFIKFFFQIK